MIPAVPQTIDVSQTSALRLQVPQMFWTVEQLIPAVAGKRILMYRFQFSNFEMRDVDRWINMQEVGACIVSKRTCEDSQAG